MTLRPLLRRLLAALVAEDPADVYLDGAWMHAKLDDLIARKRRRDRDAEVLWVRVGMECD